MRIQLINRFPVFGYPRCKFAVKDCLKQADYEDFLKERFQWDVDFVKVFTRKLKKN